MPEKKKLSNCCSAGVSVYSGTEGTNSFVCEKCLEACGLMPEQEKNKHVLYQGRLYQLLSEGAYSSVGKLENVDELLQAELEKVTALKAQYDKDIRIQTLMKEKELFSDAVEHIKELEAKLAAEKEAILFLRNEYSSFGARGCPACLYENGKFIKSCKLHQKLAEQAEEIKKLKNEQMNDGSKILSQEATVIEQAEELKKAEKNRYECTCDFDNKFDPMCDYCYIETAKKVCYDFDKLKETIATQSTLIRKLEEILQNIKKHQEFVLSGSKYRVLGSSVLAMADKALALLPKEEAK